MASRTGLGRTLVKQIFKIDPTHRMLRGTIRGFQVEAMASSRLHAEDPKARDSDEGNNVHYPRPNSNIHLEDPISGKIHPTHKYHQKEVENNPHRMLDFRPSHFLSYTTLPPVSLGRLSHEELMIPLVYWGGPPQHAITAFYVQRSQRSGDIIVTGSSHGEIVIWRTLVAIHHPILSHESDDEDFGGDETSMRSEDERKVFHPRGNYFRVIC